MRKSRSRRSTRFDNYPKAKRELSRPLEDTIPDPIRIVDFFEDRRRTFEKRRRWKLEIEYPTVRGTLQNIYGRYIRPRPVQKSIKSLSGNVGVGFFRSARARICNRRSKRREILFSKKVIGRGRGGPKEKKHGPLSQIICKRR